MCYDLSQIWRDGEHGVTWTEYGYARFCKIDGSYCDSQKKMLMTYLSYLLCPGIVKLYH